MEKNIKETISIIEDVIKSMPECTNKAFLKGALNELNEALRLHDVSGSFSRKDMIEFADDHNGDYDITENDLNNWLNDR